ncbi:MAG: glycoside hydrolase family 3 N-terminal domain-containing protein [Chitinispirillaceae bacterium]
MFKPAGYITTLSLLVSLTFTQAETISGNVIDENSEAVPNARVAFDDEQATETFTDKNGSFSIDIPISATDPRTGSASPLQYVSMNDHILSVFLKTSQATSLSIYDLTGKKIFSRAQKLTKGSHFFDMLRLTNLTPGMYILRFESRLLKKTFKINIPDRNTLASSKFKELSLPSDTKTDASGSNPTTLKVEKYGYDPVTLEIESVPASFEDIMIYPDEISLRVDSLLELMTLEEKVGQMVQGERKNLTAEDVKSLFIGSVLSGGGSSPLPNTPSNWADMVDDLAQGALQTRLGIPLMYGTDAVHGHNNLSGATIFPHNIGLGCTRNPDLVTQAARITAIETAASGPHWTFAPCIAVPRNERWGRTYEGFGETAELTVMMGDAPIRGLQGSDLASDSTIAACAKHFVGDGGTTNGEDQGDTQISEEELREIHLPGYVAAVRAEVATIMASYNSWNESKLHGHKYLISDILKDELGFGGFVVSDWDAIDTLSPDYKDAVKISINAGIDMVMAPSAFADFTQHLKSLVNENEVPIERVDDAVRRILNVKYRMGLFEKPLAKREYIDRIGSPEHREIARECVRQSLVLLKNENELLPLPKEGKKIVVGGSHADDVGLMCGGWTMEWQGMSGDIEGGTSILNAMVNTVSDPDLVSQGHSFDPDADVFVLVFGELPYAEYSGDRESLSLESADIDLAKQYHEAGIPVVGVLISGRPLIITDILPYTSAFMAAWLPGTEGQGVADVLFGDHAPTGKLSHSWPRDMNQIPVNVGDADYDPLFEYGYGLSY